MIGIIKYLLNLRDILLYVIFISILIYSILVPKSKEESSKKRIENYFNKINMKILIFIIFLILILIAHLVFNFHFYNLKQDYWSVTSLYLILIIVEMYFLFTPLYLIRIRDNNKKLLNALKNALRKIYLSLIIIEVSSMVMIIYTIKNLFLSIEFNIYIFCLMLTNFIFVLFYLRFLNFSPKQDFISKFFKKEIEFLNIINISFTCSFITVYFIIFLNKTLGIIQSDPFNQLFLNFFNITIIFLIINIMTFIFLTVLTFWKIRSF